MRDGLFNIFCKLGCGLIGMGTDHETKLSAVKHFMDKHPDQNLLVQGTHFEVTEAPLRCDLCNIVAEPPHWTYSVVPEAIPGDKDGKWLVCDICHHFIQDDDIDSLVARSVEVQQGQITDWTNADTTYLGMFISDAVHHLVAATITRDEIENG